MKKIIALLLTLILAFSASAVLAADIAVTVDGEAVLFDQQPVVENGTLLLPLRFIFEKMGGNVSWHDETRTVFADYNDKITTIQIENELMFIDGETITLPTVPVIRGDRTMITAEFIALSTGATIDITETAVSITSAAK